jgi:hypothetical protein
MPAHPAARFQAGRTNFAPGAEFGPHGLHFLCMQNAQPDAAGPCILRLLAAQGAVEQLTGAPTELPVHHLRAVKQHKKAPAGLEEFPCGSGAKRLRARQPERAVTQM